MCCYVLLGNKSLFKYATYRKRGKIHWAKLSWCLTFTTPTVNNAIIRSLYKDSRENLCGTLENHEKPKSLAQQIFLHLRNYVFIAIGTVGTIQFE